MKKMQPLRGMACVLSASLLLSACGGSSPSSASESSESAASSTAASESESESEVKAAAVDPISSAQNNSTSAYPGVTYKEAFDNFFGSPEWTEYSGVAESSDEDGDGRPDSMIPNADIVQFTGTFLWGDVETTAAIRFLQSDSTGKFEPFTVAYNDTIMPNSELINMLDVVLSNSAPNAASGQLVTPSNAKPWLTYSNAEWTGAWQTPDNEIVTWSGMMVNRDTICDLDNLNGYPVYLYTFDGRDGSNPVNYGYSSFGADDGSPALYVLNEDGSVQATYIRPTTVPADSLPSDYWGVYTDGSNNSSSFIIDAYRVGDYPYTGCVQSSDGTCQIEVNGFMEKWTQTVRAQMYNGTKVVQFLNADGSYTEYTWVSDSSSDAALSYNERPAILDSDATAYPFPRFARSLNGTTIQPFNDSTRGPGGSAYVTNPAGCNVRSGPSLGFPVLATIDSDTFIGYGDSFDDWVFATFANPQENGHLLSGWIRRDNITDCSD